MFKFKNIVLSILMVAFTLTPMQSTFGKEKQSVYEQELNEINRDLQTIDINAGLEADDDDEPFTTLSEPIIVVRTGRYKQERSYWCWAASLRSYRVNQGLGTSLSQSDIVEIVKGSVVNQTADDREVLDYLWNEEGLDVRRDGFALTIPAIRRLLSNGEAILMGLQYTDKYDNLGHMMIISGIDDSRIPAYVEYMDPAEGEYVLRNGESIASNRDYEWNSSIYME
ncbi:MAG: hypothetical protein LBU94_02465 [Clostridiales bacterium]|jgi:hypothetical protein|nr:hypothetical protein [Clostridiales bacterium]